MIRITIKMGNHPYLRAIFFQAEFRLKPVVSRAIGPDH